jgi:hypothetical protein
MKQEELEEEEGLPQPQEWEEGRCSPKSGKRGAAAPRGVATTSRGASVRRLEFVENDAAYEGDGDEDEIQEENEDEAQEENEDEVDEENEDEADEDGDGDIWLHGPTTLPPLPANEHEKWVIEPSGD